MQGELVTRRTQFSSCDPCRRSRVACDAAARAKSQDGVPVEESSVSCSRCLRRRKDCTFTWVKENKAAATTNRTTKRRERRRQASSPASDTISVSVQNEAQDADSVVPAQRPAEGHPPTTSQPYRSPNASDWSSPFGPGGREIVAPSSVSIGYSPDNALSPSFLGPGSVCADILHPIDSQWLSTIYRMGFDNVFGSWMGRFCNPFVASDNTRAEKYVRVPDLCKQLDMCMASETMTDPQRFRVDVTSHEQTQKCRQIDESLKSTMAAFSARWLPLTSSVAAREGNEGNVIRALWRHARRDMLRVINRPSYRSMLTLFLFALTPIPAGISEDEELDGISGQACVHAALQQIQILRARQRNLQFSGSKVSPYQSKQAIPASPDSVDTSNFITAESTAYWAALTFDTSASLTLNCRSLLSSGLFGFDEELSWRLVRSRAQMFHESAKQWQPGSIDMTDERANLIVGAGAAWKLLGWKLTAVFKEALRDGHEEHKVRQAYAAVVDSIVYFNETFRPHLEACHKRMHFLGQQTKLRWYSLMLHYHLSILMLVDIIEATERFDLMHDLQEVKIEAENTVMNTLVFGLHNTYSLAIDPPASSSGIQDGNLDKAKTVPLTSIDPYPHHIVAGVQLVRKAIERDFGLGKITEESYGNLQSTLERTLDLLPQSSKSVQAARTQLSEKIPDPLDRRDPYGVLHAHFAD